MLFHGANPVSIGFYSENWPTCVQINHHMSFLFQNHRITPPLIQTVTIILTTVDSINNMQAIQSDIPPVNCNLSQQSCQDKNFLSSPDFVDSCMESIYRPAASRQSILMKPKSWFISSQHGLLSTRTQHWVPFSATWLHRRGMWLKKNLCLYTEYIPFGLPLCECSLVLGNFPSNSN